MSVFKSALEHRHNRVLLVCHTSPYSIKQFNSLSGEGAKLLTELTWSEASRPDGDRLYLSLVTSFTKNGIPYTLYANLSLLHSNFKILPSTELLDFIIKNNSGYPHACFVCVLTVWRHSPSWPMETNIQWPMLFLQVKPPSLVQRSSAKRKDSFWYTFIPARRVTFYIYLYNINAVMQVTKRILDVVITHLLTAA